MFQVVAGTHAIGRRHGEARHVGDHVGQGLGPADLGGQGEGVHGGVVAVLGANVRQLLDDDIVMLARELREGPIVQAPTLRQVAGGADLIDIAAVLGVALEGQGLVLLAATLVPGQRRTRHGGRQGGDGQPDSEIAHDKSPKC
jgi:hypothetical protein